MMMNCNCNGCRSSLINSPIPGLSSESVVNGLSIDTSTTASESGSSIKVGILLFYSSLGENCMFPGSILFEKCCTL